MALEDDAEDRLARVTLGGGIRLADMSLGNIGEVPAEPALRAERPMPPEPDPPVAPTPTARPS